MTSVGSPFWVSTESGAQLRPAVTWLPATKRYLVVWRMPTGYLGSATQGRLVTPDLGVVKQSIDLGGPGLPGLPDWHDTGHVAVDTSTTSGVALVAWSDTMLALGRVRARLVSSSGTPMGSVFDVSTGWGEVWPDARVEVVWNAKTNRFLVAWDGKNQAGWRSPRIAVVNASGTVLKRAAVGDDTGKVTQLLEGAAADPVSGTWVVIFDRWCRVVADTGVPVAQPVSAPGALRMFDAAPHASGFRVIGCEPFLTNKVRVWTRVLTPSGQWSGNADVAFTTYAMQWAQAVPDPYRTSWLLLYAHEYAKNVGSEVVCRPIGADGTDLDGKPLEVVSSSDYDLTTGRAAAVANPAHTEALAVWSESSDMKGALVDTGGGLIIVQDEAGAKLPWSYVTVNGKWAGFTNASGWLDHALQVGDTIAARRLVHIGAAKKSGHDPFGSGKDWSYHVWLTSIRIRDDGTPEHWMVTDPTQDQVLTIWQDNTLIGHNLVVSFQWDASSSEIATARQMLRQTNDLLYNATDGQVALEFVKIRTKQDQWSNADVRILPSSGISDCNCPITNPPSYIRIYWRGQGGVGIDAGTWCHELLHYVCNLHDEYEKGTTKVCTNKLRTETSGPYANGGAKSSCPMSGMNPSGPYQLCTNLSENPHNTSTWQGSQTCWDIASYFLSGSNWAPANGRWKLRTPNTRGRVVPGPAKVPVSSWCRIDNPTSHDSVEGEATWWTGFLAYPELAAEPPHSIGRERPTVELAVEDPDGRPRSADLWLQETGRVGRLGSTDADGRCSFGLDAVPVPLEVTSLSPRGEHLWRVSDDVDLPGAHLRLDAQSVELELHIVPTADPRVVDIDVVADRDIAMPSVAVSPHGLKTSIPVSLHGLGRRHWRGRLHQEPGSTDGGVLWARTSERDVDAFVAVEYRVALLDPPECHELGGGDGLVELILAPGAEPQTVAALTRCRLPDGATLPQRAVILGGPYELAATNPHLAGELRFFAPTRRGVEGAEVLRWDADAGSWEPLSTWHNDRVGYHGTELALWVGGAFRDPRTTYVLVATGEAPRPEP